MVIKCSKRSFEAYAVGGSIAQEAISSIREVTALGAQEVVAIKYYSHLTEAMKWGTKSKSAMGLMTGGVTGGLVLAYVRDIYPLSLAPFQLLFIRQTSFDVLLGSCILARRALLRRWGGEHSTHPIRSSRHTYRSDIRGECSSKCAGNCLSLCGQQ